MIVFGVDPGAKGAVACVTQLPVSGVMSLLVKVMPEDLREFAAEIHEQAGAIHVFIEKAQSFPGQGIASAFNYGRHFGELLGVLHNVPHTLVHPSMWTRQMHEGTAVGDAKARSLEASRRLFPGYNFKSSTRSKKAHDGMVDAALIALYGWRKLGGLN